MTSPLWYPANRVEREMAWALAGGNVRTYLQAFLRADLFVPQQAGSDEPADWHPVTREMFGQTVVPVFTSDQGMLAVLGEVDFHVTDYPRLRASWPDPAWRLAVDPGLPIEAYLPLAAVEAAARGELLPPGPDLIIHSLGEPSPGGTWTPWPPGGPEQALFEAVSLGDGAEYLAALLSCMVIVPTLRQVDEEELSEHYLRSLEIAPGVAGEGPFPWRTVGSPPERTLEVFTNPTLYNAAYPGSPRVETIFQSLFSMFPAASGLSVNPGGPGGLDLRNGEVPLLAQWNTLDPVPRPVLLGMRWAREALDRDGEG